KKRSLIQHRRSSSRRLVSLDIYAGVSSQRPELIKSLTLVAAVFLFGATTMFSRTVAFDGRASAAPAAQNHNSQNPDSPNQDNPPPAPPSTSAQSVTAGAAPLRVMVGKSLLINTTERLKRVSVTDPSVADALVVTPTQV